MARLRRALLATAVLLGTLAPPGPVEARLFNAKALCEHHARKSFFGLKLRLEQMSAFCVVRERVVDGRDIIAVVKEDGTVFRFVRRKGFWTIRAEDGEVLTVELSTRGPTALFSWADDALIHHLHVALK
ncbi:MAG: hypothetical protein AAF713_04345 [Pseudomonadota bacterium]